MPAGLAVPEASRLWVDVLGAQPLEVSRSEVERWQRRRTRRMASVRTAGWCPLRSGKASPSRPSSGTLACNLRAFAQGVCRRHDGARPCGGGADGRGLRGAPSPRNAAHTGPGHAAAAGGTRAGVLLSCHVGGPAGDGDGGDPTIGRPSPAPGCRAELVEPLSTLTMSSRGVWGHAQGALALRPSSRRTLVDRDARLAMVPQQGKDDECDHRADSR